MGFVFKFNIDDLCEFFVKYIVFCIVFELCVEVLIVEFNVVLYVSFYLIDYWEVYQKVDIVVWLVCYILFVELFCEESKLELDFCGVRKQKENWYIVLMNYCKQFDCIMKKILFVFGICFEVIKMVLLVKVL